MSMLDARIFVDICPGLHPEARFAIGYYDDKMIIRFFDKPGMGSSGVSYILIDPVSGVRRIYDHEFQQLTLAAKIIREFP